MLYIVAPFRETESKKTSQISWHAIKIHEFRETEVRCLAAHMINWLIDLQYRAGRSCSLLFRSSTIHRCLEQKQSTGINGNDATFSTQRLCTDILSNSALSSKYH